jgi:hypothetical protein
MKIFKARSIISELILFGLIFTILITLPACSNEDDLKHNLSYLSLNKEMNDTKLTVNELNIISQALKRLEIYRADGIYKVKHYSGSEINISNELFEYVINSINHTNKIILKSGKRFKLVRFKTSAETTEPPKTDCLARAITQGLAGSETYDDVNEYITDEYGNDGVKLEDFNEACTHFFPNGSAKNPSDIDSGSMDNMIIVYRTSDGNAHAVNGTYSNGNDILYYDAQNSCLGYCSVNDVIAAYSLSGE